MENLILKTHFQEIYFKAEQLAFEIFWSNTDELTDESYKDELIKQVEVFELKNGEKAAFDTTNFDFILLPEIHEWVGEKIFPRVSAAGIRKSAIIVSQEIFAQTAIEFNMEEDKENLLNIRYFENLDSARAWLYH